MDLWTFLALWLAVLICLPFLPKHNYTGSRMANYRRVSWRQREYLIEEVFNYADTSHQPLDVRRVYEIALPSHLCCRFERKARQLGPAELTDSPTGDRQFDERIQVISDQAGLWQWLQQDAATRQAILAIFAHFTVNAIECDKGTLRVVSHQLAQLPELGAELLFTLADALAKLAQAPTPQPVLKPAVVVRFSWGLLALTLWLLFDFYRSNYDFWQQHLTRWTLLSYILLGSVLLYGGSVLVLRRWAGNSLPRQRVKNECYAPLALAYPLLLCKAFVMVNTMQPANQTVQVDSEVLWKYSRHYKQRHNYYVELYQQGPVFGATPPLTWQIDSSTYQKISEKQPVTLVIAQGYLGLPYVQSIAFLPTKQ